MTATTSSADDSSEQTGTLAPAGGSGTTVSLIGGSVATDRCAECGAALAPDQRYCVVCGTRRGRPRFTMQQPAPAPAPGGAKPARRGGSWSSATLLAGVAALLLAVGVGVLIGHAISDGSRVRVVVTTPATSSSSSGSTSGRSGSTATTGSSTKTTSGSSGSGSGSSSATVKPGGSCTAGTPGCVNGKETGNFFGG
jgi:hypothetical protein